MSPWVAITTLSNTSIMGRIIAKGRVVEGTRIISDHVQQCIAEKYGQMAGVQTDGLLCYWNSVEFGGYTKL
jgi:hypothetical protein